MNDNTIISLGGWCGVDMCIQNYFCKHASFPFDSIRTSIDFIIKCFETKSFSFAPMITSNDLGFGINNDGIYINNDTQFWHHDITKKDVREIFTRRLERLFDVIENTEQLFFIRAIQSVDELHSISKLYSLLKIYNSKSKLLIICDEQVYSEVYEIDGIIICVINNRQDHSIYTCAVHHSNFFKDSISDFVTGKREKITKEITINKLVNTLLEPSYNKALHMTTNSNRKFLDIKSGLDIFFIGEFKRVLYGKDENFIDITTLVMSKLDENDGSFKCLSDDAARAIEWGDPCYGIVKQVLIEREPKTVVVYAFHIFNERVKYFIENAIFPSSTVDFIIVCNDKTCKFECPSYVEVMYRDNIGYDFGAWSNVIEQYDLCNKYENFIFVNSSVIGPFLKEDKRHWTSYYIKPLETVRLFGSTINTILNPNNYAHVQSYIFSMKLETLEFLIKEQILSTKNYVSSFEDAIKYKEILMSRKIIDNGWNIGCNHSLYKNVDFRFKAKSFDKYGIENYGDIMDQYHYETKLWDKYELIFIKGNRIILSV